MSKVPSSKHDKLHGSLRPQRVLPARRQQRVDKIHKPKAHKAVDPIAEEADLSIAVEERNPLEEIQDLASKDMEQKGSEFFAEYFDQQDELKKAREAVAESEELSSEEDEEVAETQEISVKKESKASAETEDEKEVDLDDGTKEIKSPSDGFENKGLTLRSLRTAEGQAKEAPKEAPQLASPPPPNAEKLPDAFTLLNMAKDPGIFFKIDEGLPVADDIDEDETENASQNGDDDDEPTAPDGTVGLTEEAERAAAVEECQKLLEPVAGIGRVVKAVNEEGLPIVLIVATKGFGEVSLHACPNQVGRFETVLAIPYDILPLKKERSALDPK